MDKNDGGNTAHARKSVFGTGRSLSSNPTQRIGFQAHGAKSGDLFRTTARDKQPPSQVLTGRLLGDPVNPHQYMSNVEPPAEVADRLAPRRYHPKES